MSLEKWALIAEIIGGAAIVVTLVFLTFQMRSNTNAIQAQTYHGLMQDLNDYRQVVSDRERIEISQKYQTGGWDSLTRIEKLTLRNTSNMRWGIYEAAFYANERGVLGTQEWSRFELAVCRALVEEGDLWDPGDVTPMTDLLTPEFVQFVDRTCQED